MRKVTITMFWEIVLILGLMHGLLLWQLNNWEMSLRKEFKYVILSFQPMGTTSNLHQLSLQNWNTLLMNLHEPVMLFCFLILLMFGLLLVVCSVVAARITKSLIG